VALARREQEEAAWEAEYVDETFDEALFTTESLPRLQYASLGTLAKATGLSLQY
jgi:hypothetical protein